jgi:hypothetical protein
MPLKAEPGDHAPMGRLQSAVHNTWSRRILMVLMVGMILSLLIDPGDKIFYLKVPLFAALMLFWVLRLFAFRVVGRLNEIIAILVIGVIIPGLWLLLSLCTRPSPKIEELLAYPKAFLFLPLLLLVRKEKFELVDLTAKLSSVVAVLTIIAVIVSRLNPAAFAAVLLFSISRGVGMISENRDQFGIGVGQFYYATSSLMLFGIAYYMQHAISAGRRRRDFLMIGLFAVGLVFSGSRGNVLAAGFIGATLVLVRMRKRIGMIGAVLLTGAMILLPAAGILSAGFFSPSETSNHVKLGHYQSYMDEFSAHPGYLLFGQGEGTRFYTKGFQDFTFVTELSYLELIRQFGIPLTALLVSFLFSPLLLLMRHQSFEAQGVYVTVGYAAYLLVSATNPLLVSSTGMLVVVMVWARALEMSNFAPRLAAAKLKST